MTTQLPAFSASLFYDTVNAYFRTAAVKAAIELGVFDAAGLEGRSAEAIADTCRCSPRGIRILCYFLVSIGFMAGDQQRFYLTREMSLYLDRKSPGYLGGTIGFLLSDYVMHAFKDLTGVVRSGQPTAREGDIVTSDHPQWINFAHAMAPMMSLPSYLVAEVADSSADQPLKVLDVAASHGLFGVAIGRRNPQAQLTFLDWGNVLTVARETVHQADLDQRSTFIAGDFFEVDVGDGYDIILLPNFLHHFDHAGCEAILRKAHAALNDHGRVLIFEIIANEDRVSPPIAATFSMMMLGTTPAGEVYTEAELAQMSRNAGYADIEVRAIPPAVGSVVVAHKRAR